MLLLIWILSEIILVVRLLMVSVGYDVKESVWWCKVKWVVWKFLVRVDVGW